MKISKTRSLSLFGILILIVFNISKSNACSCDTVSFENATKYADEIFTGKVIKVEEQDNYHIKYELEVEKKWKGNKDSILIFHGGSTSCDFYFHLDKRYLVYAAGESKYGFLASLCSRTIHEQTKVFEERNWYKKDLKRLDKKFPNKFTPIEEKSNQINITEKASKKHWLIIGEALTFIALLFFI